MRPEGSADRDLAGRDEEVTMTRVQGVFAVILLAGSVWAEPAHGEIESGVQESARVTPRPSGKDGAKRLQKRRGAAPLPGREDSSKKPLKEASATPPPSREDGSKETSAAPPPSRKVDEGKMDEFIYSLLLLLGLPIQSAPLPLLLR
jgi:hypothetical protein